MEQRTRLGPLVHQPFLRMERDLVTTAQEPITDRLDVVSRALSRASGMALAVGQTRIVDVLVEAGGALDDVINDLLDGGQADG